MRALGPRFWLAALRFPITRPVGLVFANSSIAAASLQQPFRTYPSTAARFWIERWCDGCGICPARHARGFNRISLIGLIADPLDPASEHAANLRARRNVHQDVDVRTAEWAVLPRSEEHTSELQSLMRISYAVFGLKKKKTSREVHNEEH